MEETAVVETVEEALTETDTATVIISAVAIIAVAAGGVVGYRYLKKRIINNIIEKVESGEYTRTA